MDANTPNPALLRAYPYFANNQLQPTPLPNQIPPQLPNHPVPPNQTAAPSPDTNACEKLIHLARSIRARPVYEIQRIGGEDHLPLFRAYLFLTPQNYSTQGVGRSKMTARRDAATNMINIITEKALGGQSSVGETSTQLLPSPPKLEVKEEPASHEIEEGELESDDADDDEKAAPFFVDREPDPELEKEAQDQRLREEGPSNGDVPREGEGEQKGEQCDYSGTKQEGIFPEQTASLIPSSQPDSAVPKTDLVGIASQAKTEESHKVPKRTRTSLDQEPAPTPSEAPVSEPGCAIPPRKRARSIPRDFPTRLRIWIFCSYTEDVMKSLKVLAEANLFVDLSITMFSTVELPKYVLLGKSVAAEVTVLPEEQRNNATAVIGMLAFTVGAKSEQVWIERAKHLANGYPMGLSPRLLVLHDDPSLDVIRAHNVVEVMRPTDDLVQHITGVLEKARSVIYRDIT